ncbi:MAG: ATP-binding protein [Clostridia bacterium]|nr:ATP-binding protein [Clostridia bacterium]
MDQILRQIRYELQQARFLAEQQAAERLRLALNNEAYREADAEVSRCMIAAARAEAMGEAGDKEEAAYQRALKHRTAVAKKYRISEQSFAPQYGCPLCNDTGYTEDGKICPCVRREYYRRFNLSCGLSPLGLADFSQCDPSVYAANEQEAAALRIKRLKDYAENYPNVKEINLLLYGKTGTGKTFLAECVASEMIQKGYTVLYLSSHSLNQLFLRYINERNTTLFERITQADFLVIDDLGSETIIKNITCELLQAALNTRMQTNKPFIITTNYDGLKLREHYGEKLFSRIASNKTQFLQFTGADLRIKRKKT